MAEKISAQAVKALREQTGAGMMECKKALQEAEGDLAKASEIIAKAGHRKADKKASRTAAEGVIAAKIADNGQHGVMLEVNSETDFVARDENFTAFCDKLSTLALEKKIDSIEALNNETFAEGQTVEEARKALIAKIGENINIRRIHAVSCEAGHVGAYIHGTKIGVLVKMTGGDVTLAKDIAMHVAAVRPQCVNPEEVSAELVERETRIATERATESGKPAAIVEKIVAGQVQKYVNEVCLMGQSFVKDMNMTVKKVLEQNKATVEGFERFEVGEGIEVEKVSFQDEVMSTARGE